MALSARLLALRRSPVLLKLPPYLSALCIAIGVAWLLLLPLNEYSRQTYISENAILPGQVHTYFGGSEHNVFRAYRQEVYALGEKGEAARIEGLKEMLRQNGLKEAEQAYRYRVAGEDMAGTNVYGILQGPRADATEAMVLVAAWRNFDGELNYSGVALALTLARYLARWSIWSKDIVLLVPADSTYGPIAWADAYHGAPAAPTARRNVSALPVKAGALQAAVALDYPVGPWGQRFDRLDILYDGINGALPNLDLLNTARAVASGQMGIECTLHGRAGQQSDGYADRLRTLAAGVATQGVGHATGPHSAFMPYHVDAITLKTAGGDGWHDEMSLGRVAESLLRSVNNLLEHLHQSFFFYILLGAGRFVSVGNYLPSAMLVAGSFTITALALWAQSGQAPEESGASPFGGEKGNASIEMEIVKDGNDIALVPKAATETAERKVFLPAVVVLSVHLASFIPLYVLTHANRRWSPYALAAVVAIQILPAVSPAQLKRHFGATTQHFQILQSFSLLFLGATLSTMATLNFSLALVVGVLASPLCFVRPLPVEWSAGPWARQYWLVAGLASLGLVAASPPVVLYVLNGIAVKDVGWMLVEMAKGWSAQGAWTCFVVWSIWWPAWMLSALVLYSGLPEWEPARRA